MWIDALLCTNSTVEITLYSLCSTFVNTDCRDDCDNDDNIDIDDDIYDDDDDELCC